MRPGLPGLALGLALGALAAPVAHAQSAPGATGAIGAEAAELGFDIGAGPLEPALDQFARRAGINLSYDPAQTSGLVTRGLRGSHTVREGLQALLAGTGLAPVPQAAGGYALVRAASDAQGARELPAITVTGQASDVYEGGQVARTGGLGLLGSRDFLDTPFNVTSYTAAVIRDQQARSVGDVVKNDPSVRTIWPDGSYGTQFTIRGFPTQAQDMAINGLYGIVPPQMTGGLEFFDRVEILKGPSALLNGMAPSGAVGGNINLVTKRATDTPIASVTGSYYSGSQFGGHLDLGRRFGDDNRWGIRFNGAYRNGETGVDEQSQRVSAAALGLDFRGDGVRLSADVGYQNMRTDNPTRIVYTDNANFQIPRAPKNTLSLGQDWYYAKARDSFAMVQGEVDVSRNLTAYASFGGRQNDFLGLYNFVYLQNAQGDFRANQYYQPTYSDARTGQVGLRGRFRTGGVRHEMNLSASLLDTESGALAPVVSTYNGNLYHTGSVARPSLSGFRSAAPKTAESGLTSVALADTLYFLQDRVQLTVGARQQRVKVKNYNATTGDRVSTYDDERVTPAVGLVVRPWDEVSFYANYIEGLSQGPTAPAGTANAGTMFAPLKSRQYEAGVKYDLRDVAVTLSAFQIEQPSGLVDAASNTYRVDGEQRNRGVELNVFGQPLAGVRVLGGATFMRGTLTRTAGGAFDGNRAIGVPDAQVNLGGEWDLPFLPGATLTGRVIYTASQYYNAANSQSIPSWTRVDLGARYRTRMAGHPVTLRAGVENVFDRDYWAAASSSFGLARGAPRTVLLSATVDF